MTTAAELRTAAEAFRTHGTGPVSDALDLLGGNGGLQGLIRMSGAGVVAGPAFTVQFEPVEPGTAAPAADFIDDVPPDAVVVIANGGRVDCTVWGDLLTSVARRRGIAGTVIDGCCRDLDDSHRLGYSLWTRGAFMKSGKNRARFVAAQLSVVVCGTVIHPGDVVCADGSGVLAVPCGQVDAVLDAARRIADLEARVRADLELGLPLREARARHGYNEIALRPPTIPAEIR